MDSNSGPAFPMERANEWFRHIAAPDGVSNRKAIRFIAGNADNVEDLRFLLDILGLSPADGRVPMSPRSHGPGDPPPPFTGLCGHCHEPLDKKGPSEDFCSPEHQFIWQTKQITGPTPVKVEDPAA